MKSRALWWHEDADRLGRGWDVPPALVAPPPQLCSHISRCCCAFPFFLHTHDAPCAESAARGGGISPCSISHNPTLPLLLQDLEKLLRVWSESSRDCPTPGEICVDLTCAGAPIPAHCTVHSSASSYRNPWLQGQHGFPESWGTRPSLWALLCHGKICGWSCSPLPCDQELFSIAAFMYFF